MSPLRQHEARVRQTQRDAEMIREVVRQYVRFKGACPRDVHELTAAGIGHRHGYADPWGEPFVILCNVDDPDAIEVRSTGPDCTFGTEDDIGSQ